MTKDLLEILKSGKKAKITHLIYKANLSNNSIKSYIENLIKNQLITENKENEKKFYNITSKGNSFLEEYNKIRIFSEAYGLD